MNSKEALVAVSSTKTLLVDPIWVTPVDDIEGPLYLEYIQEHPNYDSVYARSTVRDMLHRASQGLPSGLRMVLRAGHRPLEVQYKLLKMVADDYAKSNPAASPSQVLEFARRYVSDPTIKLPPHCCGAAVDIDVADTRTNTLVDFGCPVNTDDEIASLSTANITADQQSNRDMLVRVMTDAGFATYDPEWWHFSYGDQAWSDMYNKPGPIYSLIDV